MATQTFRVNTTSDSDPTDTGIGTDQVGTLRQVINYANAHPGTEIDLPAGTYILGSNLPLVAQSTTIVGAGPQATQIDGGGQYRGFLITGVADTSDGTPPAITVNIANLTIRNVLAKGRWEGCGRPHGRVVLHLEDE